ncbi:hypothetical protein [Pseudobdellovibrio exovorus]|uniref:Uncharacterized protein n=1 Tax=Pseudobdellovibrio exovorus JSS TaxID=1184267 RepID=M4V7L7_9BACT|nr:hypothetical protein [Pseudobdellovibrio exovorus]AGH95392.1 hypothetical protein A11Q_1176 [Pseudobdellovibrio exovorus JSS]
MNTIKLNQKLKRVEIQEFEIENDVVFNYFDALPSEERSEKLLRALYIGVLAMMEDRLSSFLSKTANHLGTELESLKMIFDMKKEIFYKTTVKGTLAEDEIADFLKDHFKERNLKDSVFLTGNSAGIIAKNKTGDIVCEIDGKPDQKIVIECKFDKSVRLGEIGTRDPFARRADTAWSQLLEAQANRDSQVAIIVFDASLVDSSILKVCENVGFIPNVGFIAIIDSQKGNYTNLAIAYSLARDIALNARSTDIDASILSLLISKIIKDLNEITSIRNLVLTNIENNKAILKQIEKSILLMNFNQEYFSKFLKDGKLNKQDLLDFYMGESTKERYQLIEKDLNAL